VNSSESRARQVHSLQHGRLTVLSIVLLAGLGLLLAAALSTFRRWERTAPEIRIDSPQQKSVGDRPALQVEASDGGSGLSEVAVALQQGDRLVELEAPPIPAPPAWQVWAAGPPRHAVAFPELDLKALGFAEGPLEVVVTARDRALLGNQWRLLHPLTLDRTPPAVAVVSGQHYINQGGSELVLLRVSADAVESGVEVGPYFFPGCGDRLADPALRLVLIAFPFDLDPNAPLLARARDQAGNAAQASFHAKVFPKQFRASQIELSDAFLEAKVPEILSRSTEIEGGADRLASYLKINGELRRLNNQRIAELTRATPTAWQWREPFLQLSNSQVESGFADHRTYLYQGRSVDVQDHLGFDLAVREHYPIESANDGVVVFAGWLGIYGQCVIVDHGCGLASLYGHLSEIGVAQGQSVRKAQVLGRSGVTGLAGGDHLHFTMLVHGQFVNPIEWWDPHWVKVHIQDRISQLQGSG